MADMEEKALEQKEGAAGKSPGSKGALGKAILAIAVVAIIVIAGMIVLSSNGPHNNEGPAAAGHVTDVNMTTVAIPLTSISQTATWYEYNVSGSTVRFFAVKDANDTVHCAFDECWMCWAAHLGYTQNGSSMVENCCNMPFPITELTADGCSGDGCHPIFLPSKVVGDQLTIRKTDLAKQKLIFLQHSETAPVQAYNSTHVAISLSLVSVNCTWYQIEANGSAVRFFVVKEANGTLHAALDTCWKCYPKHAGYRQNAVGVMVENCCNMAFPVANVTATGCSSMMCHPVYLPSEIIGDQVVFAMSDFVAGSYMFAD